jgi:FMN phosphatase YigB (HAD superfamily)
MFTGVKVKTGLITSWGRRVHDVLRDAGLSDCFDVVVCGDDVEHTKPSAEPFLLAAESLQVEPMRCLHLGDSLRDDVFGANDAGLSGIWINRRGRTILAEENRMLRSFGHPWFSDLDEANHYIETYFRDRLIP